MHPVIKSLGLQELSLDERLQVVEELWDSIAADAQALEVPQSHKDELDRRLAAHAANPSSAIPWAEVKARLLKPVGALP